MLGWEDLFVIGVSLDISGALMLARSFIASVVDAGQPSRMMSWTGDTSGTQQAYRRARRPAAPSTKRRTGLPGLLTLLLTLRSSAHLLAETRVA
jgi:hypothetical protein